MSPVTLRRLSRLLLLPLLGLAIQGMGLQARPYRIATTPWMGWAFLDVAEAKGFWKTQGLEVELQTYPDGTSYLDAQLARKVDFSCAMVGDAVWIHTHRAPVKILLETDWSFGGDKFFIRKGKSLSQLQNRPIGYYQARYALPFFLKKALGPDFRYLQKSQAAIFSPQDLVAQFKAGRVDMGVLCDPYADDLGSDAVIQKTSASVPGSLPECFFTFRDVADSIPPKDLDALVRGILKAMAWMQTPGNAEELFRIVQARSYKLWPLRNLADMKQQMKNAPVHSPARLRERNAQGRGLEGFLKELHAFLKTQDPQGSNYRPSDLFDPQWIQRRLTDGRAGTR